MDLLEQMDKKALRSVSELLLANWHKDQADRWRRKADRFQFSYRDKCLREAKFHDDAHALLSGSKP
jgi:hypothetical protein